MNDDENLESLEIDKTEGSKEYLENSEKETHSKREDIPLSDTESIFSSISLGGPLLRGEIDKELDLEFIRLVQQKEYGEKIRKKRINQQIT